MQHYRAQTEESQYNADELPSFFHISLFNLSFRTHFNTLKLNNN